METLLIIVLIAAFTGLVTSVVTMYNLLSSKNKQKNYMKQN